jgi:hypothetical protein
MRDDEAKRPESGSADKKNEHPENEDECLESKNEWQESARKKRSR